MTTPDNESAYGFDSLDELARVTAKIKADVRRQVLELFIENGGRLNGASDLQTLDDRLASVYLQIDRNAAAAERGFRERRGMRDDA